MAIHPENAPQQQTDNNKQTRSEKANGEVRRTHNVFYQPTTTTISLSEEVIAFIINYP
jgi:hypothetical protein